MRVLELKAHINLIKVHYSVYNAVQPLGPLPTPMATH